ncbi:uncharacterized protein LOC102203363 isoform X4 [Pundamilia nyererei]|uniref:Uncharacterized protein LOC102203363 isoform X4 n=1 Tax=Pundamilia nyererei TaxID=303518 RepID=A0A9Y6JG63_9CICH|nr:PREDICTED: uncharacterized protein LOC102203363 isoform X4 [Pundamilia nyererei]XP_014195863.1 uncharacterized protein LOC102290171 isoform X2 [Haplochromis burtoni]
MDLVTLVAFSSWLAPALVSAADDDKDYDRDFQYGSNTSQKKLGRGHDVTNVQHPLFFQQQGNIWESSRPVAGPLGEECC